MDVFFRIRALYRLKAQYVLLKRIRKWNTDGELALVGWDIRRTGGIEAIGVLRAVG